MSFYADVIQQDPRFYSTEECRDLALLEPVTRAAVAAIIADAEEMGIQLIVTETYRSAERQQQLFAQGATQLETVGVHHYGLAADFCKIIDGKASWAGDWGFLCKLADAHGCLSGGDWGASTVAHSFRDFDHIQRINVQDQDQLFSQVWYPEDTYLPVTS
jgi:hypothetical protein